MKTIGKLLLASSVLLFATSVKAQLYTPPSGLIAYWAADGNAADSVGGNNGTVLGATYSSGVSGQAFDFIPDSRVTVADNPVFMTPSFTLTGWVYPRASHGMVVFRGDDRGGLDTYTLNLYTQGKLSFLINSTDSQSAGIDAPIALNTWTHFAATFDNDSGAMQLYLNGDLKNEVVTDLRPILELNSSGAVGIGNHGGTYHQFGMNGKVDEVGIYSRALTGDEIAMLVPEPHSLALVAVGAFAMMLRRRKG